MALSQERINTLEQVFKTRSDEQAAKSLGVTLETLYRYKRTIKHRGLLEKKQPAKVLLPKVLLLDIETLPAEVYVWRMWDQNIGVDQIISSTCMLSYSVKWLFLPEVYSDILTPAEAKEKNDERIVKGIWEYLNDADVVIAHNGKAFDTQYINARFIVHKMTPPGPYKVIDTLYIRKCTKFDMNNLDYLCRELGLRPKIDAGGFKLWEQCSRGDQEALNTMRKYNEGDVLSLEELYVRLRPWLPSHPNLSLYLEGTGGECPRCLHDMWEYAGKYSTTVNIYKSYRCLNCGAIMRRRDSDTPRLKKPNLMVSVNVM